MGEPMTIYIKNGNRYFPYVIYKCERCGRDVEEAHPHKTTEDGVYCWDCAFIEGLISESEYLSFCGVYFHGMRAAHKDGQIYLTSHGRKFPWEKTNRDYRHDPRYAEWRTSVFVRDKFTCQICGQVGGTLNAHHIKPFATNEKLRFDIDNGVTLCKKCHRRVHRENDMEWIK